MRPRTRGNASVAKSNVNAYVAPQLKAEVENIFISLGLDESQAITIFYNQVKQHNGLPFDYLLQEHRPPHDMDAMTPEEFDAELQKGWDSMLAGNTRPFSDFYSEFRKDVAHGIRR